MNKFMEMLLLPDLIFRLLIEMTHRIQLFHKEHQDQQLPKDISVELILMLAEMQFLVIEEMKTSEWLHILADRQLNTKKDQHSMLKLDLKTHLLIQKTHKIQLFHKVHQDQQLPKDILVELPLT